MNMNDSKKVGLFKYLVDHSMYEAGIQFEFDKRYKTPSAIKNNVHKIYREVQQDPEKFSISQETIDLVTTAVSNRRTTKVALPKFAEIKEQEEKMGFSELALGGRNKALQLLHHKLDRIGMSKKKLDSVSVGEMAKVYGILFDKAQIIRGEATERVAILSKNITLDMRPEEAIEAAIKMRETNYEAKVK